MEVMVGEEEGRGLVQESHHLDKEWKSKVVMRRGGGWSKNPTSWIKNGSQLGGDEEGRWMVQ